MDLISVEGYKNAKVHTIQVKKDLWISIKDVGNGLGVKNISDLVLKEILLYQYLYQYDHQFLLLSNI